MVVNPDTRLVASGSNTSFECLVFANNFSSSLNVTWEYPTGANIFIEGTKLVILNASTSSEGEYKCRVHSKLQRTVTAVGILRIGKYACHIRITFLSQALWM